MKPKILAIDDEQDNLTEWWTANQIPPHFHILILEQRNYNYLESWRITRPQYYGMIGAREGGGVVIPYSNHYRGCTSRNSKELCHDQKTNL